MFTAADGGPNPIFKGEERDRDQVRESMSRTNVPSVFYTNAQERERQGRNLSGLDDQDLDMKHIDEANLMISFHDQKDRSFLDTIERLERGTTSQSKR